MANLNQLVKTATIANGASLSDSVDCGEGRALISLMTPAAWTAAAITFDVSADNTTFAPLYDSLGAEVIMSSASIATAAARAFALDPAACVGWRYVKVRSGVNGAAVNQGAARSVTLVFREVN